jgi:hypothetical protein
MNSRRGVAIFYRFVLPVFTVANLGLGLFLLTMLRPPGWLAWLELGTGALCCCIAGWLAGAAWTKSYWASAMERQVRTWRRIVDATFGWLEDAPVPADSIHVLKRSLDKVILG